MTIKAQSPRGLFFCWVLVFVAVCAAAIGVVMECWGYSGHSLFGRYEFVPVVIVGVLVFVISVLRWTVSNGSGSRIPAGAFARVPTPVVIVLVLGVLFGAGNLLVFLARMAGGGGSPQYNGRTGQYELASHGGVTIVSRSVYDAAVINTHQLVLGLGIVFACVGAGLSLVSVYQNGGADQIVDPRQPLSTKDTVTVEGSALTAEDPPNTAAHRAHVIADADGLHVNFHGLFNSGARETSNSLLPPHLRSYDWSAQWAGVTGAYRTSARSFVVIRDEQSWVHVFVSSDQMMRRIDPFLVRIGRGLEGNAEAAPTHQA